MKPLLGKSWHRIPTALLVVLLIAVMTTGAALAATSQDQTITQVIWEPVDSSVTGLVDVTKPDLLVGTMSQPDNDTVIATVTVIVGTGDAGSTLTLTIDDTTTTLYNEWGYGVVLSSVAANNPMGVDLMLSANTALGTNPASEVLTEEGTYIFTEIAGGMAGNTPGTANVVVDISLSKPGR